MKSGYLDDMPWDAATKARLRKLLTENAKQARSEINSLKSKVKRAEARAPRATKKKTA